MEKRNIKIIYEYDGSKFYGFQRQKDKKTVQGEIERIIKKSFSEDVNLISSGRTDKGVHAKNQVSNFIINKNIPVNAIKLQLNKNLKKYIKIKNVEEVDMDFNARYNAKKRTYLYVMKVVDDLEVFETDYISTIKSEINVKKLEEIMKIYIGKHNFSSFMKKDKAEKNVSREIYSIKCDYNKNEKKYTIEICGNSFLKTMVRIMIGSALAVYFNEREEDYIEKKLKFPDENGYKILAQPEGLYLYNIEY